LAGALREAGFDAEHVHEVGLRGAADEDLFHYCQTSQRSVVTCDLGFGNVLEYPPPHGGIVVARFPEAVSVPERIRVIVKALTSMEEPSLQSLVVTVEVGRLRVRR
jgi:predicted nuclease of predicted toxin-antitoxin system